jgi:antirestriction protein ArdC
VVKHGGDRAFYSPEGDFIQMPPFGQFKSPEAYVSTKAHEFAHNAERRIMPRRFQYVARLAGIDAA